MRRCLGRGGEHPHRHHPIAASPRPPIAALACPVDDPVLETMPIEAVDLDRIERVGTTHPRQQGGVVDVAHPPSLDGSGTSTTTGTNPVPVSAAAR